MVLFDQATYDKMLSDIPKAKLITPSTISERLRVIRFFFLISRVLLGLASNDDQNNTFVLPRYFYAEKTLET